ncbi:MAG: DNA cytosine methyltransferase, partial [Longicatena sp.]
MECYRDGCLPDVLKMENVPDVIGSKNMKDFMKWYAALEAVGYQSYYKTLNAKDYTVPQNRDRCFMVSILGDYNYSFPKKMELNIRLKDILEKDVDEKYYLSIKQEKSFNNCKFHSMQRINNQDGLCHTIDTMQDGNREPKIVCNVNPSGNGMNGNVYLGDIAPTLTTNKGEGQKIVE